MLEWLKGKNFQVHETIDLKFDELVTTITGRTNAGKSSLVRALQLICTNRPGGNAFVRWGAHHTTLKLGVDGHVIGRKKGEGINLYRLDDKTFKAFSASPPDAVSQLLNVGPINFQFQLDPPFWFLLTPGQVSKEMNQIVNLGAIDHTMAEIAREMRKARSELDVAEERLTQAVVNHARLSVAAEIDKKLVKVEGLQEKCQRYDQESVELAAIVENIERLTTTASQAHKVVKAGSRVLSLGDEAGKQEKLVVKLRRLLDQISAVENARPAPNIRKLTKLKDSAVSAEAEYEKLAELVEAISNAEDQACQAEKGLKAATRRLEEMTGGNCPLCGKPMK